MAERRERRRRRVESGGQLRAKSLGHVGNLLRAENGGNGGKERMQGKRGKTKVMEVPVGTVVWEEEEREDVVVDDNAEVTKKMMANWGSSEPVWDDNDDDDNDDGDNLEISDDGEHDDDELEIEYIRTAHLRPRGYKYGIWRVLADLSTHEDEFKLAEGGRGGKGNANFQSENSRRVRSRRTGDREKSGFRVENSRGRRVYWVSKRREIHDVNGR